jgi:hypothetical protein
MAAEVISGGVLNPSMRHSKLRLQFVTFIHESTVAVTWLSQETLQRVYTFSSKPHTSHTRT